jgi:hypothetical protein
MNGHFAALPDFEFSQFRRFSITDFLARFDAIFTLNQDLLLDLQYAQRMPLSRPNELNGICFPGMRPTGRWMEDINATWSQSGDLAIPHNAQPIYKLHGAINWLDREGGAAEDYILIMGDNKAGAIAASPVLRAYSETFRRVLSQPGSKLMVIGYGFRDEHINAMLCGAHEFNPYTMYLIHPGGLEYIREQNSTHKAPIRAPAPIEAIPVSDYTQSLAQLFGGGDALNHGRLNNFFSD